MGISVAVDLKQNQKVNSDVIRNHLFNFSNLRKRFIEIKGLFSNLLLQGNCYLHNYSQLTPRMSNTRDSLPKHAHHESVVSTSSIKNNNENNLKSIFLQTIDCNQVNRIFGVKNNLNCLAPKKKYIPYTSSKKIKKEIYEFAHLNSKYYLGNLKLKSEKKLIKVSENSSNIRPQTSIPQSKMINFNKFKNHYDEKLCNLNEHKSETINVNEIRKVAPPTKILSSKNKMSGIRRKFKLNSEKPWMKDLRIGKWNNDIFETADEKDELQKLCNLLKKKSS